MIRIVSNKQHTPSSGYQVMHYIILLLCAVVLIGALLFHINETELYLFGLNWPLRCFLYQTLGIKCALCGLTRSLCALAHGDFHQSLDFHPLGPAIFAFICLQISYRVYALTFRTKRMSTKLIKANVIITVILLIAIFVNWLIYLGGLIL